jgi:hypothetical protein
MGNRARRRHRSAGTGPTARDYAEDNLRDDRRDLRRELAGWALDRLLRLFRLRRG